MKFNKVYNKFKTLFTEGIVEGVPMEGEQVSFIKGWEKDPYVKDIVNTSTGERIRAMVEQTDDPLIATGVQYKHPHAYGSFGSPPLNNEKEVFVTVSRQYAIGLYADTVTVPASIVQTVENGINQTKLSDRQNKEYKTNYKGEEPNVDKTLTDPTTQTHASWKDNGVTPTS
jgi:hypothetical protein